MEKRSVQMAMRKAITGFTPAVFVLMALVAVGLPLLLTRGKLDVIKHINWWIFLSELILMTAGFVGVTMMLPSHRTTGKRSRAVISGIGAVILLAVFSVLTQGAGLMIILVGSLLAGMLSALGTLKPFKTA